MFYLLVLRSNQEKNVDSCKISSPEEMVEKILERLANSRKGPLVMPRHYRVGDYRIICALQDQQLIALVLEIGHRRDV
jgi:mRNA-degrading endonuclease RelE of RelBE toxin-antitoxin system